MGDPAEIETFIAAWRDTGGYELANTHSFLNGLCRLLGIGEPAGSRTDDAHNDYRMGDMLRKRSRTSVTRCTSELSV